MTTGIAAEEIRGDFNLTYAVMLNGLIGEIINIHAREELVNRIAMCGCNLPKY